MRKFYVTFRKYRTYDDCVDISINYDSIIITLDNGEKANLITFESKLNEKHLGDSHKEIISWSLIEE